MSCARPGVGFLARSAVHGLAMLVLEGPLAMIAPQLEQIGQRLLDMVEKGLYAAYLLHKKL